MSEEQLQREDRHRGRGQKWRSALRILLVCSVVVALVTGLGSVFFYRHLNDNITFLDVDDKIGDRPDKVAPGDPINVLIMGSDSRGGDEGADQTENGGARSDTTILMHLSSDRKFAYGVSLPRDAVVDRPACTTDDGEVPAEDDAMFNTAFYHGGVACTVKTVESLTGVKIDHWVVVNFNGFKGMVNAIGGVEVCVPHAIDDDRYQMHLEAGTQMIRDQEALDYVRVRHGFGDGSDIGRMKRQQAFVASMAARVVSAGTLTRVDRLVKFLDATTKSLALDTGVGNVLSLAKLGNQFRTIGLDNIEFITVPWQTYEPDPNRIAWRTRARRPAVGQDPQRRAADPPAVSGRDLGRGPASAAGERSGSSDPSRPSGTRPPAGAPARRRPKRPRRTVCVHDRRAGPDRPRRRQPRPAEDPERGSDWTGRAAAGWPRCSATSCPRRPRTSARLLLPLRQMLPMRGSRSRYPRTTGVPEPVGQSDFCLPCAASRSLISLSSVMSSGVPGAGLGKNRSLALT